MLFVLSQSKEFKTFLHRSRIVIAPCRTKKEQHLSVRPVTVLFNMCKFPFDTINIVILLECRSNLPGVLILFAIDDQRFKLIVKGTRAIVTS